MYAHTCTHVPQERWPNLPTLNWMQIKSYLSVFFTDFFFYWTLIPKICCTAVHSGFETTKYFLFLISASLHLCGGLCVCRCAHTCVWRPEVSLRCWFLRKVPHWPQNSPNRLHWLASKPQGSAYFFPSLLFNWFFANFMQCILIIFRLPPICTSYCPETSFAYSCMYVLRSIEPNLCHQMPF